MFLKKNDSTFYLLSDKKKENALFSIDIFEKLWTEFRETREREREKKIVKMFEKFLIRIGDKYFENREIFGRNWNRYFIYLIFLLLLLGNMSEKWWVKKIRYIFLEFATFLEMTSLVLVRSRARIISRVVFKHRNYDSPTNRSLRSYAYSRKLLFVYI